MIDWRYLNRRWGGALWAATAGLYALKDAVEIGHWWAWLLVVIPAFCAGAFALGIHIEGKR